MPLCRTALSLPEIRGSGIGRACLEMMRKSVRLYSEGAPCRVRERPRERRRARVEWCIPLVPGFHGWPGVHGMAVLCTMKTTGVGKKWLVCVD